MIVATRCRRSGGSVAGVSCAAALGGRLLDGAGRRPGCGAGCGRVLAVRAVRQGPSGVDDADVRRAHRAVPALVFPDRPRLAYGRARPRAVHRVAEVRDDGGHRRRAAGGGPRAGPRCRPTWRQPTPAPPASPDTSDASKPSLSEVLGEQVWRESGIGGPDDAEQLQARITTLEQQIVDLELTLQDRDDDLAAARAANRELMAQLNRGRDNPQPSE